MILQQQKAQKNISILPKSKFRKRELTPKVSGQFISKYATETCEKYMQKFIEPEDERFSTYSCFLRDSQPQPESNIPCSRKKIPIIQVHSEKNNKRESKVSKKGSKILTSFKKQKVSIHRVKGKTPDWHPEKNCFPLDSLSREQINEDMTPSIKKIDMLRAIKNRKILNSEGKVLNEYMDQYGRKQENAQGETGRKQKNNSMPYTHSYTGSAIQVVPNQNYLREKTNIVEVAVKVVEKNEDETENKKLLSRKPSNVSNRNTGKIIRKRDSILFKKNYKQLQIQPQSTQFLINFSKIKLTSHMKPLNSIYENTQTTQNFRLTLNNQSRTKSHLNKSKSLSLLDYNVNQCCVNISDNYLLLKQLLQQNKQNMGSLVSKKQSSGKLSRTSNEMKKNTHKTIFLETRDSFM